MGFLGLALNILRVGVAHDISGRSYQVPRELFFFSNLKVTVCQMPYIFGGIGGIQN